MITLDKQLSKDKEQLLAYFRSKAAESIEEIRRIYGTKQIEKQASAINKAVVETRNTLIKTLIQRSNKENWNNEEIIRQIRKPDFRIQVTISDKG